MLIKLNKKFKDEIRKKFKRDDSILSYDLDGTFKVLQEDYTGDGNVLVRANDDDIYNTMIVLSEHYEIVR